MVVTAMRKSEIVLCFSPTSGVCAREIKKERNKRKRVKEGRRNGLDWVR